MVFLVGLVETKLSNKAFEQTWNLTLGPKSEGM